MQRFVASGLQKLGACNRLGCKCSAIKGYKSIGFERAVAKIHIEAARKAPPQKRVR
jgi:hypothetical protein